MQGQQFSAGTEKDAVAGSALSGSLSAAAMVRSGSRRLPSGPDKFSKSAHRGLSAFGSKAELQRNWF